MALWRFGISAFGTGSDWILSLAKQLPYGLQHGELTGMVTKL
jgi:hypothetical protein